MNSYFKIASLVLISLIFGCKDDDPDPRQAFVDTYEMEDMETTLKILGEDTIISVQSNPEIEFTFKEGLHSNELQVELDDFIEDVVDATFAKVLLPTVITAKIEDEVTAKISGTEFEIDLYFIINASSGGSSQEYIAKFESQGELDGEEISMDFEINLVNSYIISGTATGEKK